MKRRRGIVCLLFVVLAGLIVPTTSQASAASTPVPERGIAILFADDFPLANLTPAQLAEKSRKTFTYVASVLHANAISLNFPFYMDTPSSPGLHSGMGTPTTAQLASVTRAAQARGLRVQYRPFLSEANFATPGFDSAWRGTITPPSPAAWIAQYGAFLRPYFIQARKSGVTSFSIAAELNSLLNQLRPWQAVVHSAQTLYGGTLIYSGTSIYQSIPKTSFGWDDYTPVTSISYKGIPVSINENSTAQQVSIGFKDNLQRNLLPSALASIRLEEVGIAGLNGAYAFPWAYYLSGTVNRAVQANWFTAACNAFFDFHMRGLYYWGLELEFFEPGTVAGDAFQWYGTAGADAIAACYSRTS